MGVMRHGYKILAGKRERRRARLRNRRRWNDYIKINIRD
jgi:hypothetical protein